MTKISLDITKSVEQNAEVYFEKAKKSRGKIDSIKEIVEKSKKKLQDFEKKQKKAEAEKEAPKVDRKKEWYEKFRWFVSSEGFLIIGGRDATTNEIVIKKHTDKEDVVFHTDMSGSPFFVVKTEGKKPTEKTLQEVSDATASYSKAWKLGMATTDVFWVNPDQVSKEANQGEYMSKGAFMIRGKTNYLHPTINLAIGLTKEGVIMGGPVSAIKKNCEKYIEIEQGKDKTSAVAKKIKSKIGGDLDEIVRCIPAGGVKIKK